MKKKLSILIALVMAISLCLTPAVALAQTGTQLVAVGTTPGDSEARIVVNVPAGTTLGSLASIEWDQHLVSGYAPHVDIIVQVGAAIDALVVEFAYNHVGATRNDDVPGVSVWGCSTGATYKTFGDSTVNAPAQVDPTSNAWLTSQAAGGAAGPPGETYGTLTGGHYSATIANWRTGNYIIGIDANTPVLRLEIEVDNWIMNTTAWVDSILVNNSPPPTSVVGLAAVVPDIVAISVTPVNINFGTVNPGQTVTGPNIVVANIGTHEVDVNAWIPTGTVLEYVELYDGSSWNGKNWTDIVIDLAMGGSATIATRLPVPTGYTPGGSETATLTFIARGSP